MLVLRHRFGPTQVRERVLASHNPTRRFLAHASKKGKSKGDDAAKPSPSSLIRNVGVAAHVDAGKTTVSERFLFYSNVTRGLGEVHDGAAVMDYLPQERERGITINAAAITFPWSSQAGHKDTSGAHKINLIDTPGHVDFTMEVERSMRVMDGAVIVIDSVAGVEAQTETVWRQANRYGVSRILFANKMDREGASLEKVLSTVSRRLGVTPLPLQVPIGKWGQFRGVVDLVTMRKLLYEDRGGESRGREFETSDVSTDLELIKARETLLENIAELDEEFAETFLSSETPGRTIPPSDVARALRRVVSCHRSSEKRQLGVPLVMGSALRNMCVQPLLDAVVDYLPSPTDPAPQQNRNADPLSAFVFKIQHNPQRGPLAFVRVFNGSFKTKDNVNVVNATTQQARKERVQGILRAEADDFAQQTSADTGDICVLAGLSSLRTGDTIGTHALPGLTVPPSVFSASLELDSLSQEAKLDSSLAIMVRDDPSLSYGNHPDTGELLIHGVGELHLDVTVDRLKREHGVQVEMGVPRVALLEHVTPSEDPDVPSSFEFDRVVGGVRHQCTIQLTLVPTPPAEQDADLHKPNVVTIVAALQGHPPETIAALKRGVEAALTRGPLARFPVVGVHVRVDDLQGPNVSGMGPAIAQAVASFGAHELLKSANHVLLEPVLLLQAVVPEPDVGDVLGDLTSKRRADILAVEPSGFEDDTRVLVKAALPAAQALDYSRVLRALTQGHGSFTVEWLKYAESNLEAKDYLVRPKGR